MDTYILKHKNFRTRLASRSGGFFTAISDYVFDNNGIVYGVVLENNIEAKHIRTEKREDRDRMRGSKYVQSNIGDCYKMAKYDLQQGRNVLFTGTPCQIAGLKKFLGKEYSNLITTDIVCHGVPSPRVWRDYISNLEADKGKKIKEVDFRNKYKYGWVSHLETITYEDNNQIDSGVYANFFYSHKILRPCCYKCPFKILDRISDFSIGDAWGIDSANPEFNDNNGVSIVLVNTNKASELFAKLQEIEIKSVSIADYMQPPFKYAFSVPDDRDVFWTYYCSHTFRQVLQRYKWGVRIAKLKKKIYCKIKEISGNK